MSDFSCLILLSYLHFLLWKYFIYVNRRSYYDETEKKDSSGGRGRVGGSQRPLTTTISSTRLREMQVPRRRHPHFGESQWPSQRKKALFPEKAEALGLRRRGGNEAPGAFQSLPWPGPGPVAHEGNISWPVAAGCVCVGGGEVRGIMEILEPSVI